MNEKLKNASIVYGCINTVLRNKIYDIQCHNYSYVDISGTKIENHDVLVSGVPVFLKKYLNLLTISNQ